jgi:hypothetical protein
MLYINIYIYIYLYNTRLVGELSPPALRVPEASLGSRLEADGGGRIAGLLPAATTQHAGQRPPPPLAPHAPAAGGAEASIAGAGAHVRPAESQRCCWNGSLVLFDQRQAIARHRCIIAIIAITD